MPNDPVPQTPPARPICFVISPIGAVGSPDRINADHFLKHLVLKCPAINKYGYDVKRSDHISEPGRITTQIINMVALADLVIADLTGLNPNVFYELALRHASRKPLITCVMNGTTLPFDLRDFRTIHYSFHVDEAEQAIGQLDAQIDTVNAPNYRAPDPIGEAIQTLALTSSQDPTEKVLGQLLQTMRQMASRLERLETVEQSINALGRAAATPQLVWGDVSGKPPLNVFHTPTENHWSQPLLPTEAHLGVLSSRTNALLQAAVPQSNSNDATKPTPQK